MTEDLITLAHEFIGGRNLKRSTLVEILQHLLDRVGGTKDVPHGVPDVQGYDAKPPIAVTQGVAGSVYLGPESNRYYTPREAVALAGAIARATQAQGR